MKRAAACLAPVAPPTETDRLDHLLGRIGSELDRLAERLSQVGVAQDGPADPGGSLRSAEIIALQSVDQAEQIMRELAVVLRRAAASEGGSIPIDLARLAHGLPLAHTTAVILGTTAELEDGGDLDLF